MTFVVAKLANGVTVLGKDDPRYGRTPKQFANKTQAQKACDALTLEGYSAWVRATRPFYVVVEMDNTGEDMFDG